MWQACGQAYYVTVTVARQRLSTGLTIAAVGPAIFAGVGPLFGHTKKDVRFAEIAGTAFLVTLGLGTGMAVSDVDGFDPVPVVFALAVSAVMVGYYEWTLRNHPTEPDKPAPAFAGLGA